MNQSKGRIKISSALRSKVETSLEHKEHSQEVLARKKVRDALNLRKKGLPLSLEELRREAMGEDLNTERSRSKKSRVRLSAQRLNENVHLNDSRKGTPQTHQLSPNERAPLNIRSKRKCRDAIFFKSDVDYENYLQQEKDLHGLYPDLYDHLKILYVSRRNLPSLLSLWNDLETMGMDSCDAHLERAETLRKMDEVDKAMVYLEKAIRVDPASLIALRSLTITNKLNKDYEMALHWGEKWRQLAPREAECSYQLGAIHHRAQSIELAQSHLKRALELDPSHLMARSLLESIGYDR